MQGEESLSCSQASSQEEEPEKKHARKNIGTSSNNVPTAFAHYWHQISANQRMTLWIGLYRGPKAAREATESQRWFLLPQTCYGFQPPSPTD